MKRITDVQGHIYPRFPWGRHATISSRQAIRAGIGEIGIPWAFYGLTATIFELQSYSWKVIMDKSQVAYIHRGWRGILLQVKLEMLSAPGLIVSVIWSAYRISLVALISGRLDIWKLDIEYWNRMGIVWMGIVWLAANPVGWKLELDLRLV